MSWKCPQKTQNRVLSKARWYLKKSYFNSQVPNLWSASFIASNYTWSHKMFEKSAYRGSPWLVIGKTAAALITPDSVPMRYATSDQRYRYATIDRRALRHLSGGQTEENVILKDVWLSNTHYFCKSFRDVFRNIVFPLSDLFVDVIFF